MKRLFAWLVMLMVVAGFVYGFMQYRAIPETQDAYEAARWIYEAKRAGEEDVTFFYRNEAFSDVYDALECMYPYAFSLNRVKRSDGLTTFRVEVSRPARQAQARAFAQSLAQSVVTPEMDDAEKLRALHDALVRLCVYDMDTASNDNRNGDTAPFAADGALLDHLAVCAGYGRAFVMLCEAVDVPAVYIASEEMNHGWNAVLLDGKIYYVDCTFDDPVPDRGELVGTEYFLCTEQQLLETHTWDTAFYNQIMDKIFFEKS